jgi:ribosomal protein L17
VPKSNPWRGAPETAATYFHSDAYFRDGPRGQIIKEETAWKRRADTREEISRVMNNPDREFMDREGGYRRIIRWYD